MKKIICLLSFFILCGYTCCFAGGLSGLKNIEESILESLQTESDKWIFSCLRVVYSDYPDELRGLSFPGSDDRAKVVLFYDIYRGYVGIEKPIDKKLEDGIEEKILHQLKIMLHKNLADELGYSVPEIKPEIKPEKKPEPVEQPDPNGFNPA